MATTTHIAEDEHVGRRTGTDRRTCQVPVTHPERRRAERRSGSDRRTELRDLP
ncbi:hypothetical protein [Croceibacterium aestuarii]|uniref:hypothetical protein n=1 Tax=Croceibacterium aestuarii TaxID=3064139 RepID=UPI00272E890C|nr:hypothetical protein [Croceibacterium sp. D39]